MTSIDKLKQGAAEYRRKLAAGEIKKLNPIEKAYANPKSLRLAINGKCWECSCGQRVEITKCTVKDCCLWGVRPYQR